MTEWKGGNTGSVIANNMNMEDGPIISGSYSGLLSLR
jgi:hypothetical protein